jgi:hypothetical protein
MVDPRRLRPANRVVDAELDFKTYLTKGRVDRAINGLLGLVEGMAIDQNINAKERDFLDMWLHDWGGFRNRHPFSEVIPVLEEALRDGVLSEEERLDLKWLCERLRSESYFETITADMQRLHGILGAIASDGVVTEAELAGLSEWLGEHDHLRRTWPFDEVESVVMSVMRDKRIDPDEHKALIDFFREFTAIRDDRTITQPSVEIEQRLTGVCAVAPEIQFAGSRFCFTGASTRMKRSEFFSLVTQLGGEPVQSVTKTLDYLVIGADGNPCWAYSAYGRKVEQAVHLRKKGVRLLIVHEIDFHDAVEDPRGLK